MEPILLTILFVLFAILAWRNLTMALILLSGLLPVYLLRINVGPIPSTALEVLILICLVAWLARLCYHRTRKDFLKKSSGFIQSNGKTWIKPILLLIAAASFGVTVAPDTLSALGIWKAYFIEPLLVAIMMLTVFNKKDWALLFQALSISAITLSIAAIVQYFTGIGIPVPWDIELRVTSFFDYPNALGLFLAPIVSLHIVAYFLPGKVSSSSTWQYKKLVTIRAISILTIILGLIAITLSQTEAALVAIPTATIATLLISPISKKKKQGIAALAVIALAAAIFAPAIRSKILLQDYSGQVRLLQWAETIELIKDKPFFGAGLSGYPEALKPYHNPTQYEIFQYPHNIFLNTWVELGIIGLIALFWLGLSIAKRVNQKDFVQLSIFAALLTICIHGLVDVPYFKNDLSILTWILLAAFIATQQKEKKPMS